MQRDLAHQQQELERIEAKLDGGISKLQGEIEKIGTKMRTMFEKLLYKELLKTTGAPMVANAVSNEGINSSVTKPIVPHLLMETVDISSGVFNRGGKPYRLECPHFNGGDFSGWIIKLE